MTAWRNPPTALVVLAVLLLIATLLRPTLQLQRPTYRYVFVFDISQSMNVTDIPGAAASVTRLDYAKQATREALSALPCGSEAGLALFTGHRAYLLITPIEICANYREVSNTLDKINWRMSWEFRSEIAKSLYKSISLMQELSAPTRLVFLTDGHEAPPINPDLPPQFAGEAGDVRGLIVGVGGDTPVAIPKFDHSGQRIGEWKAQDVQHVDAFTRQQAAREGTVSRSTGTEHLSSLREVYLQGLAAGTGLLYHRLIDGSSLASQLRADSLSIPAVVATDVRWVLALGALLAFCAMLSRPVSAAADA